MAKLRSLFLFYCFLSVLVGCSSAKQDVVTVSGPTMGTTYHVKVVASKKDLPSETELKKWADDIFAQVNQSMSTYIDDSELSSLNRGNSSDFVAVSSELFEVLQLSQEVSSKSNGAFDVTVGPLVDAWGFGPEERSQNAPSNADIQALKARIGYKKIQLDKDTSSVSRPVGLKIDLSAVAKGYGADVLAQNLLSKGYQNLMVEVGGELYLHGINQRGEPWRIGIETPNYELLAPTQQAIGTVSLSAVGMATSGDYRNFFEVDGQRFSHTINPVTGKPITHNLASVTVIAKSAALADAWATALNVIGPENALEIAEQENLAAFIVVKQKDGFETRHNKQFEQYLGDSN